MKKLILSLLLSVSAAVSSQAYILLQDSVNYPYTNGCIEGQGQWFCYSPSTPVRDANVTNNVLYLNVTNKDSVATPTNGFYATTNGSVTFASFTINVSQLPATANGGYFYQFQDVSNNLSCCRIFIDTLGTQVPGTFRLGVGNFSTSFNSSAPPIDYPEDLVTGVTYTVVCEFDTDPNSVTAGSTLWIDPSSNDYTNSIEGDIYGAGIGVNFVYGTDKGGAAPNIAQVGFSPYVNAGISNVLVGTEFADVVGTNLPVFGVQPQSQTNYSGNGTVFLSVAAGADLNYQWFSASHGALTDDGVNIIGSTSNILYLNNLSTSDNYYAVATDAYGNQVTSATATNTVITTPTPVFFPANVGPLNLTNNLFTYSGFTNTALGTGPIYYQWYFAPTNTPNTYSPLGGQTSNGISFFLADYSTAGNYYLLASNAIDGGTIAFGPTNSLSELAPLIASLLQLHNLEISQYSQITNNLSSTLYVNTNNVIVSGYVTTYGGFGSSSYSEFFMQDTNGYGVEVYLPGFGNTNTPPVGSYATITGEVEIYNAGLELAPTAVSAVSTNPAPAFALTPVLENANFLPLVTNALGTNQLLASCSLMTFTNVYIYGSRSGGALGTGGSHSGVNGLFYTNGYNILYFTVGAPYSATNTKTMEIFQPTYFYTTSPTVTTNPFFNLTIPTHCSQLTGVYIAYGSTAELEPSRPADYVTAAPSDISAIQRQKSNKAVTLTWPVQTGSTYSVLSATNLGGPWVNKAYGLNYYPVSGTYVETNTASAQFYKVTSP